MRFAKIAPSKQKSLRVAERLFENIRRGEIAPGERLPSERELAEYLGVSRTVVREALSALQMSGVVERRVGDGTYIANSFHPRALGLPPLLENLDASISVVEAIKAREALDISVADMAIANANEEELAELDDLVEDMREAIQSDDFPRYLALTLDLHIAIARVAGNSVLEQAVIYLIELIRPHIWVVQRKYDRAVAEGSLSVHAAIVEGIRKRDLEAVIAAVRKHYREYPSLQR